METKFDAVFSNATLHWCKREPKGVLECEEGSEEKWPFRRRNGRVHELRLFVQIVSLSDLSILLEQVSDLPFTMS